MKRSMQEIVELVVFGLIAVLLATGVLWLVGWLLGIVGTAFIWLAGLVWAVLRFVVPVAVVAAIVYLVVRLVQQGQDGRAEASRHAPTPTEPAAPPPGPAEPAPPPGPTAPPPPTSPTDDVTHDAGVPVDEGVEGGGAAEPPPSGSDEAEGER